MQNKIGGASPLPQQDLQVANTAVRKKDLSAHLYHVRGIWNAFLHASVPFTNMLKLTLF